MRKALVVAKKLGLSEFQQWIKLEIEGYETAEQIPGYRFVTGQVKAYNPYRGWIDLHFGDPKLQLQLSKRPIGQAIGELETLSQADKGGSFHVPFHPETEHQIMNACDVPMKPTLEVSFASVSGILDKVRDIVLNWCLDLEAKGILGEGMTFSEREKQTASEANYHVHFHGPVTTSQIQQGSIQSSQTITGRVDVGAVRDFVAELRRQMPELELGLDLRRQVAADLASIEAQLGAPILKPGVVAECLRSLRNILEGCAGSLIASGLLERLSVVLPH